MGARGLVLVGCMSACPLVLIHAARGWETPVPLVAWGLVVWLAWGGLPRSQSGAPFLTLAMALPSLALAAGLDVARGQEPRDVLGRLVAGLAILGGLAWAAGRANARYRIAWVIVVPGLAAVHVALVWAPLPGPGAAPWLQTLGELSPLVWAATGSGVAWPGVLAALTLCAMGWAPAARGVEA